jgi:hypothetical protein
MITNFGIFTCLIVDVNFGFIRRVDVGSVADVSDTYSAADYRVEIHVCSLVRFFVYIAFSFYFTINYYFLFSSQITGTR